MKRQKRKSIWIAGVSVVIVALALILSISFRNQVSTESETIPNTTSSPVSSAVASHSVQQKEPGIQPSQPEQQVDKRATDATPELARDIPDAVTSQPAEPATPVPEPTHTEPQGADGMIYVPGFGWIPDEGGGGARTDTGSDGAPDKQIGEM